ncbi:hypothetical protein Bca52824_045148 [Brassica carinata]|uniref:Strictosidine synthase conserved region domain-containing protein n=1 Tax=Brassica carinata TaxID=52824 RepID=A0A8X7RAE9_BRACI|nr:hypothetical protein Bca52824_045148 [Brassica carinata]
MRLLIFPVLSFLIWMEYQIDQQLPHMLPSEQAFAAGRSALGIDNKDGVVVYDGNGLFSAARVWCFLMDPLLSSHIFISW